MTSNKKWGFWNSRQLQNWSTRPKKLIEKNWLKAFLPAGMGYSWFCPNLCLLCLFRSKLHSERKSVVLHLFEVPNKGCTTEGYKEIKKAQHLAGIKPTISSVLLWGHVPYRCATTAGRHGLGWLRRFRRHTQFDHFFNSTKLIGRLPFGNWN